MLGSKAIAIAAVVCFGAIAELPAAPTHLVKEKVVSHKLLADGVILLDFGKVAFGNLVVNAPNAIDGQLKVHFGEAFEEGRIHREPPGSVRYQVVTLAGLSGRQVVAPAADERNTTHPSAVSIPNEFGVVLPFRWVEIEGWAGEFDPGWVERQSAYLEAWDDELADFKCSDETLNRIWNLCKHSIKATTFAGIYVDGDRERIPYEADAYLNQLSHYYTDGDKQIARDTYDYLMEKPTWPTEWAPHMVFMAHADWMHTGDAAWLKPRHEKLRSKLLMERVNDQGWVISTPNQQGKGRRMGQRDIVDWPKGERDGYVFTEINTVVNAFHLRALRQMADILDAVGSEKAAALCHQQYQQGAMRFHEALWMPEKGCFRDGVGTDHAAAHATFFPLAFGLVPDRDRGAAVKFLKTKGMACSVYGAQYLMEALFENGAADYAIELMLADSDRSWKHMVNSGTTITWEAWDQKYKPNQDWNHAWGAAPSNLLPRYVLGVEPAEPGWSRARIEPRFGGLEFAQGKVPTPVGPIEVFWERSREKFQFICNIPQGMEADVSLPNPGEGARLRRHDLLVAVPHELGGEERLRFKLKSGRHVIEFLPAAP